MFNGKKGFVDGFRGFGSIILGLVAVAFGLIPLLHSFDVIGFDLPFSIGGIVLEILLIIGAFFLFFDSIHEDNLKGVSIITGLVFLVFGAVPLLVTLGVIGNDFTSSILAIFYVKCALLVIGGILLMFGSGD